MDNEIPPALEIQVHGFWNGKEEHEINDLLDDFHRINGIESHQTFRKGFLLAQSPYAFDQPREDRLELSGTEKKAICRDKGWKPRESATTGNEAPCPPTDIFLGRWLDIPWPLWKVAFLCAIGGTIMGWDEAAINAAQPWYWGALRLHAPDFSAHSYEDIKNSNLFGLINSAPYLSSAFTCWLAPWTNARLGRRGTIFWCAIFSAFFAFAQGFVRTWQELLLFRLLLGLGIGIKSATCSIYVAECAPANARGSFVMLWQVFTALGIMAGSISGVIFVNMASLNANNCKEDDTATLLLWKCSAGWWLMLASPCVLPLVLAAYIYGCHESPRWTIREAHILRSAGRHRRATLFYQKACRALNDFSRDPSLAARDMISEFYLLDEERKALIERQQKRPAWSRLSHDLHELFVNRRNRRALVASAICMFAQQFCGVNIIVYYSNVLFTGINESNLKRYYLFTMGTGIINVVFAIPAWLTIDTIGRRTLLLAAFPFMAIFHVITAIGFGLGNQTAHEAVSLIGMSIFMAFYSIGEGPVPFVYAADSMPLHIRAQGMAFATSINWLFNWFIAFTGPAFFLDFGAPGTFVWYAAWCVVLWFAILFLVPETRSLTLEELDYVFRQVSARDFARHAWQFFLFCIRVRKTRPLSVYQVSEEQQQQQTEQQREQYPRQDEYRAGFVLDDHEIPRSSSTDFEIEHVEEK